MDPATAALTRYEIFTLVASFLPGLPTVLALFQTEVSAQCARDPSRGLLPRLAVRLRRRRELDALYRLLERHDCMDDERVAFDGALEEAAVTGHLDEMQWLLSRQLLPRQPPPELLDVAVSQGYTDMAQWLHNTYPSVCASVSPDAATQNAQTKRRDMFVWICDTGVCEFTTDAVGMAARTESLGILRELYNRQVRGCPSDAINDAVDYGHANVLYFLVENSGLCSPEDVVMKTYQRHKTALGCELTYHGLRASSFKDETVARLAALIGDIKLCGTSVPTYEEPQSIQRSAMQLWEVTWRSYGISSHWLAVPRQLSRLKLERHVPMQRSIWLRPAASQQS